MTTFLMPSGRVRGWTNAGVPAAGCLLYTYEAGTSTPKETFTDAAGLVAHANPIILDAKGEALIYWDGNYKVDLKTAGGVQITGYPIDNFETPLMAGTLAAQGGGGMVGFLYAAVYGAGTIGKWLQDLATVIGSSLIGFLQAGTGAALRTVQSKLRDQVSVKDFGAVGDGVADDAAEIQAAINTGKDVYFPDGDYLLGAALTISTVRQNLHFSGNAILKVGHAAAQAITISAEWVTLHNMKIQNAAGFNSTSANGVDAFIQVNHWYFTMRGGIVGGTGVGQYARGIDFATFAAGPPMIGAYISTLDGVRFDGGDASTGHIGARYGEQANLQRLIGCHFTNYAIGVSLDGSWPGFTAYGNAFEGNTHAYEFNGTARHQDGLLASVIADKYYENNGVAFYIANGDIYNLTIENTYVSGKGTAASHFLQVSDTAALGKLTNIVIDNCYAQNVDTIFKMGTSLIEKMNWKVSRITTGTSVTTYSSGNFAEQVMMYNEPPVIGTLDLYGGAYPYTQTVDAKQNCNVFMNTNGGGETRFQLPAMGANYYDRAVLGMTLTFTRVMAYSMKIYPAAGQNFAAGGVGKYLELTTTGSVTIMCTGINWAIISSTATLFYEP